MEHRDVGRVLIRCAHGGVTMTKKLRVQLEQTTGGHPADAANRWRLQKRKERYEIEVFVEARGRWEPFAVAMDGTGIAAEALTGYVVDVLNEKPQQKNAVNEAVRALEALLEEGLTWATEMDADHASRRLKEESAAVRKMLDALDRVMEQGVTPETKLEAARAITGLKQHKNIENQF